MPDPKDIGDLLVKAGLITAEDLQTARKKQSKTRDRIETILISEGYVHSRTLVDFLAHSEGMQQYEIGHFEIDPEVIGLIPKEFAIKTELVPLDRMGKVLTVGMICPLDPDTITVLEEETGLRIKPLLCSAEDIRAAIKRYYQGGAESTTLASIEAPLKLTSAVTMLRHIDGLPGLPGTVTRVREMLYDDDGSTAEVGEVISRDPAVTAKLLRVANSAAYGLAHRVDNVALAVSLLGLLETYSVVVSTAVINVFDRSKTFNYMAFWLESMICATMAQAISKHVDKRVRTGIFSAGLLHDIGRVALAEVAPKQYGHVDKQLTGLDLISDEEKKIGLTHTEAGYQLAQHWGLPPELAETIRFHHAPAYASDQARAIVSMVNIADVVSRAHRVDSESREIDFTECRESMMYLEVAEDDVIEIFNSVPKAGPDDSLWSPN